MCLLKFGNRYLEIAELPDSIHISPENISKIQDYSGIAIRNPVGILWRGYFLTLIQASMLQNNSDYLDSRKGNINAKEQLS